MDQNFQEFCEFVKGLLKQVDRTLEIEEGRKYAKLVSVSHGSRSVWCFVEKKTGHILKPASWKIPAKHARGNVQDKKTYETYPWTGPHYLR